MIYINPMGVKGSCWEPHHCPTAVMVSDLAVTSLWWKHRGTTMLGCSPHWAAISDPLFSSMVLLSKVTVKILASCACFTTTQWFWDLIHSLYKHDIFFPLPVCTSLPWNHTVNFVVSSAMKVTPKFSHIPGCACSAKLIEVQSRNIWLPMDSKLGLWLQILFL